MGRSTLGRRTRARCDVVGASATAYLAGAITGSLVFGKLTDRYGRKRLFLVTLGIYIVATTLTACSWNFASFAVFRLLTGAAIGGEYAAISSAIDELLPARVRGLANRAISASCWLGTAAGAALSMHLLDPRLLPPRLGWRFAGSVAKAPPASDGRFLSSCPTSAN